MKTRIAASTLLASLFLAWPAIAQDRFNSLPGFDSYQNVLRNQRTLVTGGSVQRVQWSDDGKWLTFSAGGEKHAIDLENRKRVDNAEELEIESGDGQRARGPRRGGVRRGGQRNKEVSPDGRWTAECRAWNVVLTDEEDESEKNITTRGNQKLRYGAASWVYGEELDQNSAMWWSPDSSMLAFYEFDEAKVPNYYLTGGLTSLYTEPLVEGYPKPGQPNPVARLMVYHIATGKTTPMDIGSNAEQYVYQVRFSPDGHQLLFNRTNRHQNDLELVAADPLTGASRVVVRETQDTWQKNRPYIRFLDDGERFIWETEKTGYKQFELRHIDGRLIATLTSGNYPADRIVKIDEQAGVIHYMAHSDSNPLNVHLHRVRLDGTGHRQLTREPVNHSVQLSPNADWFISTYQTTEAPPTAALYAGNGERIMTLAESDISGLEDVGIDGPELFSFLADDGKTMIYGYLHKPSNFNPNIEYPLIIDVYGGPFSRAVRNTYRAVNPLCEFGFIIAKIDNRGTVGRGKAFESASYLKLGTVDLGDQAAGVKHLAKRPYIDGDRVGVIGHSYGGYMAALAVMKHPDVFHVAVAGSPVTDWKNYDSIYTERYMRTPEENPDGYEAGSCLTYVDQFEGDLLLMHGMIDNNVHPSNSWQLIDALQRAGKRVHMYFFPRSGHGLGSPARQVQWEFLYDNLIGKYDVQ